MCAISTAYLRPDAETIHRSEAVDVAAIYKQYGGMVRRRIRRFFSAEEADDVLQEVFVIVVSRIHTFRGESSPTTWLYQVTTHYCLNQLRNTRRRKELWEEQGGSLSWSVPTSSPTQEEEIFSREVWRDIDAESAQIGVYYYLDGMTHAEIAQVMGCSNRTVGNRLTRLRERIRVLSGVRSWA